MSAKNFVDDKFSKIKMYLFQVRNEGEYDVSRKLFSERANKKLLRVVTKN